MEKTPEEIKRGLKVCHSAGRVLATELWCEKQCPYMDEAYGCSQDYLHADALAYIQQLEVANAELLTKVKQLETKCHQLEQERNAAVNCIGCDKCDICKHRVPDDALIGLICEINDCDCRTCDADCRCKDCSDGSCFEWLGVKEE